MSLTLISAAARPLSTFPLLPNLDETIKKRTRRDHPQTGSFLFVWKVLQMLICRCFNILCKQTLFVARAPSVAYPALCFAPDPFVCFADISPHAWGITLPEGAFPEAILLLHKQTDKLQFIELFGRPEDNNFGWNMGTIRDIVSDVRYGSGRQASSDGKYPYLRMNNITYGGELDLTDLKRINVPDNELTKCTVRKGDVLFNRTNSKELVGKTCLYDRDETMVLAGFVIRVRMNEKATPEFLVQYKNLPYVKELLLSMCKTACGQANINAQELQNIPIYIPPIDIQKRFITLRQQTDKSKICRL